MNTKKLARVAAVGAVTSVTALLLGSTPAVAQEDEDFPTYSLGLVASGLLKLDATPYTESLGELVTDQLTGLGEVLGEHDDAISLGVLTTEAEHNAARALTSVTELNVLDVLSADAVNTFCDDGEGGLEIVNGSVLGMQLPETAAPNTRLSLSPLLDVVLNEQRRNADGSLTVSGIKVNLLPAATDPSVELSEEEQAALPAFANLLGAPLDLGSNTVGGVLDSLNGVLGTNLDLGTPLQSITIGGVNCPDGGDGGHGDEGDGSGDEGDGSGDDNGDDSGDDSGSDVSGLPAAPAPSVVAAALPVTG